MIALKTPQAAIDSGVRSVAGDRLELVIDSERSAHGYDSKIIDVYEPDPEFSRWIFVRRVKRFHRTVHLNLNGMRYPCKQCAAVWAHEPRRGDEIVGIRWGV